MSMRIALYETQKMIDECLSGQDFQNTRHYVMKNVYLLTSTQNQRLGYALDSWWYGIGDYVDHMRTQYSKLTRQQVNAAIKKYLSAKNMHAMTSPRTPKASAICWSRTPSRRSNTTPQTRTRTGGQGDRQ